MKYRRNASTLIIILTAATTFAAADYSYAAEGSDGGSCTTDQRTPKEISTYVKNLADALREIRATAKANP
ncbi:MAG TPA: hypothetical protein PK765_04915 [bacterium]|nr:hypothetical protein [bacterium]